MANLPGEININFDNNTIDRLEALVETMKNAAILNAEIVIMTNNNLNDEEKGHIRALKSRLYL